MIFNIPSAHVQLALQSFVLAESFCIFASLGHFHKFEGHKWNIREFSACHIQNGAYKALSANTRGKLCFVFSCVIKIPAWQGNVPNTQNDSAIREFEGRNMFLKVKFRSTSFFSIQLCFSTRTTHVHFVLCQNVFLQKDSADSLLLGDCLILTVIFEIYAKFRSFTQKYKILNIGNIKIGVDLWCYNTEMAQNGLVAL